MTGVQEDGCSPKALKAFKLMRRIGYIGLIAAILYWAALWLIIRNSSPSFKAPEINSFSSTELSGAIYIPTVFELQTALCNAGYTVEVDCVVGEETKRQWDSFCADRMAAKYINPKKENEK